MAKAIALTQTGFNGQPMFASQVALNTSLIYNIEDGDVNARIFYKNADGTVLNIVETSDTIGDILTGVNAVSPDVRMFSVYDTNFNLILIPTASFMMASELNDGGSIITYINNSSIATARVNNSIASLVNIINGVTAGQYDSGQITIDTSAGFAPNQYVSAVDNTFKNNAVGFYSGTINYGLLLPNILWQPNPITNPSNPNYGYDSVVYFKPSIPWTGITKLTVYSNLTAASSAPGSFGLKTGYGLDYYLPGTTTVANPNYGLAGTGNIGTPGYGGLNQVIAGTPSTTPYTPNAGDAGTLWGELIYTTFPGTTTIGGYPIGIGDTYYGQTTENIPTPTLVDNWVSTYITFIWRTNNATPNLKFRFVIDYI
jgi:hypothetical protein